jgi:hypothetical protein
VSISFVNPTVQGPGAGTCRSCVERGGVPRNGRRTCRR